MPSGCSALSTDPAASLTRAPPTIRVLLIEDDFDVAAGLAEFLEPRGVYLDFAYSAGEARTALTGGEFDVVILDVQLPDGNGVELCRQLKAGGLGTPVLFLTARGRLDDKLAGFEAGGVDYVVKPFAPAELYARIRALAQQAERSGLRSRIEAGTFVLERETGLLRSGPASVALQASGLRIVEALMEASPGTVPRERLCRRLWGDDIPESDPLRMHIHALRTLLRSSFGRDPVVTVRGLGYRFEGGGA